MRCYQRVRVGRSKVDLRTGSLNRLHRKRTVQCSEPRPQGNGFAHRSLTVAAQNLVQEPRACGRAAVATDGVEDCGEGRKQGGEPGTAAVDELQTSGAKYHLPAHD
jgi:hypothetical protein